MVGAAELRRLAAALGRYGAQGYTPTDVPWMVPREVSRITCPVDVWIMSTKHGDLVGSAEQSFLHLERMGQLTPGKFVAWTPCFRDEEVIDDLHLKCFVKVELYRTDNVCEAAVLEVIADAEAFMNSCLAPNQKIVREATADGWDLTVGGIEVGSYGLRHAGGMAWIYGTGLAEPRFSTVLARRGI